MTDLKTGDIVLFSGKGFVSTIIKILTFSKWSHVGMVIIDDNYHFPLLYESTHDDSIQGLDSGKFNKGVQCVPLHERISSYKGDVAVRRLHNADLSKTRYKLNLMRKDCVNTPFERSKLELFSSIRWLWFLRRKSGNDDLSSQFCSENTAQAHIELGLHDPTIPSNKYTPAWYSRIRFLYSGAYFGNIQTIKKRNN